MRIYVECGYSLSNRMLSANGNSKNEKGEREGTYLIRFQYMNVN